MKTLRLICTYKCPRSCVGCCNKQDLFVSDNIEVFDEDYSKYDTLIITGGEPLLNPAHVTGLAEYAKYMNPNMKVILYSAQVGSDDLIEHVLKYVDGLTLTLHEQADVDDFNRLNFWLLRRRTWIRDNNKSLRLNVFKGVDVYMQDDSLWKIQDNMVWVENCPLPKNEEIRKLKNMW